MIWICPGDSARGMLRVARREIAPTLPVDRIVSVGRDFSRGNLVSQKDYGFPEDGEAVVWHGDSAPERCAMLYAVNRLHARHRPVTLVHVDRMSFAEMPPPDKTRGVIGVLTSNPLKNVGYRMLPSSLLRRWVDWEQYRRWKRRPKTGGKIFAGVGELRPEEAAWFYERRRGLSDDARALLAAQWDRLVQENAPLRVVENGEVVSAAADYYDERILACVPEGAHPAALTIGRACAQIHVSDDFLFERIRALAAAGAVEIVTDGGTYRDMVIQRGTLR